ncbi:MAG: hypothetical protein GY777_04635 [Candidatus Brocadiaceae bacterium]|jgi:hypothetical protein|nr:hypothetical protein [Candidatus Brocadiaceae bacterium]
MNEDKNTSLKNIAKYAQVLLSDGIFVKSEDKNIASIERKNLVKSYIKLIRNNLDVFEKEVNSIK